MVASGRINPQLIADSLRESLARNLPPVLTVSSDSMMPLLRQGDEVVLTAVTPDGLHSGEIVTYFNGIDLITHRFWRVAGERLLFRGDRPMHYDPPVFPEQVIGRVQERRRNGRTLSLDFGRGAWLNRHLAWLVQWEYRCILRQNMVSDGNPWAEQSPPNSIRSRLLRRLILFYASWLCTLIHLSAR